MEGVLSERALLELNENGFVRTGLHLPPPVLARVRQTYEPMPASASNWGYFLLQSLTNYSVGGWKGFSSRVGRKLKARRVHRHIRETVYDKSIFGSSDVLPVVLEECLGQGLAGYLGDIPLLVGHDIYLEHDRGKKTFGFHEDGFGWDIFFQTGDDLTIYIPLQDLTNKTGGRLLVERHGDRSKLYRDWNDRIRSFASYCRKHHAIDHRGVVTRQSVEASPDRRLIAREYAKVIHQRAALAGPGADEMNLVDAAQGEVILFNNKRFHAVEPWQLDVHRAIYIIRFFPLYDMGLAPPVTFLNDVPCNRFVLDGCRGTLTPVDCDKELPRFVPIPS